MTTATFGVTGALRTLRKLTGEELHGIWTQGDNRSRWGSLSAHNQHRWDDLAEWVGEHAITEIDVTDQVGDAADRMRVRSPDGIHRSYPHDGNLTDDDIAKEAESFLRNLGSDNSKAGRGVIPSLETVREPLTKPEADLDTAINTLATVLAGALKKFLS